MSITVDQLVQREINCCLSSLVGTLAGGYGYTEKTTSGIHELMLLAEQAAELSYPIDDYEEALSQAGWTQTPEGWWWREPRHEDEKADFYFLGSGPFVRSDEMAATICEQDGLEPYQWEVFEHWAVSPWLAERLLEEGEKVDTDFAGMNVWARTCSGQGIAQDGVIIRIHAKLTAAQ